MAFKWRFPVLIWMVLGIGFGFLADPHPIPAARTIPGQILELGGLSSVKSIDFEFKILKPTQNTPVDKTTWFQCELTNLSTSDEILEAEDIDFSGIFFDPPLNSEYVDKENFLFPFFSGRIHLAPGESYTGLFAFINWSDKVPVGYVQEGELFIVIQGEEQRQPFQITITASR